MITQGTFTALGQVQGFRSGSKVLKADKTLAIMRSYVLSDRRLLSALLISVIIFIFYYGHREYYLHNKLQIWLA